MKKYIFNVVRFGLVFFVVFFQPVHAKQMVFGLSPNTPESDKVKIQETLLKFLLTNTKPSDKVVFFNAFTRKVIGTFQLPNKSGYNNPNAKAHYNRDFLAKLISFYKKKFSHSDELVRTHRFAIQLPYFLKEIDKYIVRQSRDENIPVIIIGNPLHIDGYGNKESKKFNMTDGKFPSDGAIFAGIRSSLYSTKGHASSLKNMTVYIGSNNQNWGSDLHQTLVERFWYLYSQSMGGTFAGVFPDIKSLFSAFTAKKVIKRSWKPESSSKVEVVRISRNVDPDHIKRLFQRSGSDHRPSNLKGRVSFVGITWDCKKCDFDLYVRPAKGQNFLYYSNKTSVYGEYYKDYTDSPDKSNHEHVDLIRDVNLLDFQIAINFYDGSTNNASGKLVLIYNDHTYLVPFKVKATNGNKGEGSSGAATSDYWTVINPVDIVMGR